MLKRQHWRMIKKLLQLSEVSCFTLLMRCTEQVTTNKKIRQKFTVLRKTEDHEKFVRRESEELGVVDFRKKAYKMRHDKNMKWNLCNIVSVS